MKREHLLYLLLILLVIFGCTPAGNQRAKDGVENVFIGFMMIFNLVFLGVSAMAFSIGYNKRKKDKETLLIVSLILLLLFSVLTYRAYITYNDPLVNHPFVMGEFVIALVIFAVTVLQLVLGIRRKKNGFISASVEVVSRQSDDEIRPDQEIF